MLSTYCCLTYVYIPLILTILDLQLVCIPSNISTNLCCHFDKHLPTHSITSKATYFQYNLETLNNIKLA